MKTLLVLSALAAVALAAPTFHEQGSEDFKKFTNVPETIKRERKSTQEPSSLDPSTGAPLNLPSTSHVTEFGVTGRSFGLIKKPIIIKKKPLGYQVYRDSDEVPVESGETCGSQVKVKFCDGKTKVKSSTIEDTNTQMTEDEMKRSITLAKEAIENLQKDLSTVEQKSGTQGSSWNHGHSESDADLHQDIENAREALEHIHNNFENFESMSLHAEPIKEDGVIPETSFTIAKSEEQRLAQWKEAIDTIQKNVEIAKNIEDSFRMAPDAETGSIIADGMMFENSKQESDKKIDHNMRTSEDKHEHKIETENCKISHANEKSSEHENIKQGLADDDMLSSASTISEKKMKEDETRETSELLADTKIDQSQVNEKFFEGTVKEKEADVEAMNLKDLSEKNAVPDIMKLVKNNESEKEKKIAVEERADKIDASINTMKAVEAEDMLLENQQKAAVSTESLEKLETKHHEMKSVELLDTQANNKNMNEEKVEANLHTEQSKQTDTPFSARSAEEDHTNPQEESLADLKTKTNVDDKLEKPLAEAKIANSIDWKTKQATPTSIDDIEHMEMKEHQPFHPEMRSEDLKNMHQQLMMNPHSRWAEDKNMQNMQQQRDVVTSATDFHHHVVHPSHHHHIGHGMNDQHFEMSSGHGFHSDFPEHFMTEEKSADQNMLAYYMKMRESSGLAPENHRFRWKPMHEGSRSAYGAPQPIPVAGPPAGSAVGVFPNAHIGGCGIPLLLSCNPSVVPGSLAKPAVPYSPAPAYRSENDFNFQKKRDVKKTHEILSSPLHRTFKPNKKTSTLLAAKQ